MRRLIGIDNGTIITVFLFAMRDPAKLYFHDTLLRPFITLLPHWIKPNHFTILRFLAVPIVLWFLLGQNYGVGIPLFVLAASTDMIDGSLARLRNEITSWGVFYDPLADKLLVGSVLLLIVLPAIAWQLVGAMLLAEVLLIIGGWVRKRKGTITGANMWGKSKMVLQVMGILFVLLALALALTPLMVVGELCFALAILLAIISLITYSL
jgi:CDP-diacylglycerol--glycerol-3-phosphate 3-phosphatidyltransferase